MSNKFKVFLIVLFSFAAIGAFSSIKYVANAVNSNQHSSAMPKYDYRSTNGMMYREQDDTSQSMPYRQHRMNDINQDNQTQSISYKQHCH